MGSGKVLLLLLFYCYKVGIQFVIHTYKVLLIHNCASFTLIIGTTYNYKFDTKFTKSTNLKVERQTLQLFGVIVNNALQNLCQCAKHQNPSFVPKRPLTQSHEFVKSSTMHRITSTVHSCIHVHYHTYTRNGITQLHAYNVIRN